MTTIRQRFFLDAVDSVLVVIDVQERLCKAMDPQVLAGLKPGDEVRLSQVEVPAPGDDTKETGKDTTPATEGDGDKREKKA